MLESELDEELGYSRYDYARKNTSNSRNGYSKKTVTSSMYAKGMTTRDILTHLQTVYGVEASAEMISRMTDRILPIAK